MFLRHRTRAQVRAFEAASAADVINVRYQVTIRDKDEKPIGSLSVDPDWERATYNNIPGMLEGQIDEDMGGDVEQQAAMTFSDPEGKLEFAADSPSHSAIGPRNFVSVTKGVWVEDDWENVPEFWGPLTHYERQGDLVTIEALGKESLALDPHLLWRTMRIEKGSLVTEAIKRIMRQQGERRFDFPELTRKVHRDMSLARHAEPWKVCLRLANSIDRQLFYDGAGVLRLRRWPEEPVMVLGDRDPRPTHAQLPTG